MGLDVLYTLPMTRSTRPWFDVPSVLLVVACVWTAVIRLRVTEWTDNLWRIEFLAVIAVGLGLVLGQSRFSARIATVLGVGYALTLISWQIVSTMDARIAWLERTANWFGRLSETSMMLVGNEPITDPILFFTWMAVLYWIIGYLSGFLFTRWGKPWIPLGVAGLVVAALDFYHPFLLNPQNYTGAYALFLLILVGRLRYVRQSVQWQADDVVQDVDLNWDLSRNVLVSVFFLLILAWNIPSIIKTAKLGTDENRKFNRTMDTIQGRIDNFTASFRTPIITSVGDVLADSFSLGRGAELGDDEIFIVKLNRLRPEGTRYYWRGRSFDQYENGRWNNTIDSRRELGPLDIWLQYPGWEGRLQISQTITLRSGLLHSIYITGFPLGISRPTELVGQSTPRGLYDTVAIVADPPLRRGEGFRATSLIAVPTENELRDAGNDYPDWVKERYLQLPESITNRTRDLALVITREAYTPYDKAAAITQYLRENIAYSETVPESTPNHEIMDWFLFEHKQGFCNYYATAEVVMLRSVGVPARLVLGYAEGQVMGDSSAFSVKQKDSHAWPEVYFPGYGWVEFEPTVSQTILVRLPEESMAQPPAANQESIPENTEPRAQRYEVKRVNDDPARRNGLYPVFIFGLVSIICTWLLAFILIQIQTKIRYEPVPLPRLLEMGIINQGWKVPTWLKNWSDQSQNQPMEKLILSLDWMIHILGKSSGVHLTAAERVHILVCVLPDVKSYATILLTEYQFATYSQHPYRYENALKAQREIRKMVFRVWLKRKVGI
jgi:transglutaminase-like putative cysteine protease